MGLFDIFKKKQTPEPEQNTNDILLAMPLFSGDDRYHLAAVLNDLKATWDLDATGFDGDDNTAVFSVNDDQIALAYIPAPIPSYDIGQTAAYAYNWPNALIDLEHYTGHAILSIMAGSAKPLERFKLISMLLCSILRTSNATGVYQGAQSLLIPREQYLDAVEILKEGEAPITLWVYIGIRPGESGNSVYTYGLTTFNKKEIEIIDSQLNVEELYDMIYNITSYVIGHDVTLNHGETIGVSPEQKIAITHSKGVYVDGETIKLAL